MFKSGSASSSTSAATSAAWAVKASSSTSAATSATGCSGISEAVALALDPDEDAEDLIFDSSVFVVACAIGGRGAIEGGDGNDGGAGGAGGGGGPGWAAFSTFSSKASCCCFVGNQEGSSGVFKGTAGLRPVRKMMIRIARAARVQSLPYRARIIVRGQRCDAT